jgi:CBS domain-containing protein
MMAMRVAEIMTREVRTTRPEAPLREAAATMAAAGVSGLPVCDGDGRIVGMLSEGDILRLFQRVAVPTYVDILGGVFPIPPPAVLERQLREVTAYRVDQVMTRGAVTITPQAEVAEAARRMRARGVKRLPVVDEADRLVGIVSRADIVRAFATGS